MSSVNDNEREDGEVENGEVEKDEYDGEFLWPVAEGFTVYTKNNCRYCQQLATLLAHEAGEVPVAWVAADGYIADGGAKKARFLAFIDDLVGCGIKHRTFPMVFIDGKFVGGFSDTEEFLFWRKDQRFNVTF